MLMEVCRATADGTVTSKGDMWVWRILSRNGRFVAQCPKPYVRKKACEDIALKIANGITAISVEG